MTRMLLETDNKIDLKPFAQIAKKQGIRVVFLRSELPAKKTAAKFTPQRKAGGELKCLADCFGAMPELKEMIDLDALRGRNDHKW